MVERYIALTTVSRLLPNDVENIERLGAVVPYITGIDNHYIYVPETDNSKELIEKISASIPTYSSRILVDKASVEKQVSSIKKSNTFSVGDIVQCPTLYSGVPFTVIEPDQEETTVKLRLRSSEKILKVPSRYLVPAEDPKIFSSMIYHKHGRYLLIDCDALTLPEADKYMLAYNFVIFVLRIKIFYQDYDLLICNPDRIFFMISETLGLDILFGDYRGLLLEQPDSAIYTRDPRMRMYCNKVIYTTEKRLFVEMTEPSKYNYNQMIAAIRLVNQGYDAESIMKDLPYLEEIEDYPIKPYEIIEGKEPDIEKMIEMFCSTCTQDLSSNAEHIAEILH